MANLDLKDFNARVKRIKDPRNNSYYDPDLGMHVPKKTSHAEIKKVVKANKFSVTRLLLSMLIGAVAIVIAQVVRLRYLGMNDAALGTFVIDVLLAAFVVLVLSALLRHRKILLRSAQLVGAVAMFISVHNLMWLYPEHLAIVYTVDYVDQLRGQTEPMTVVLPDFMTTQTLASLNN